MLGPQGKLVVKELGLDGNLEDRPGLTAWKGEGLGCAAGAARSGLQKKAWPCPTLYHAQKRVQRQQGAV